MNTECRNNTQDGDLRRTNEEQKSSRSTLAQIIVAFIIGLLNINNGMVGAYPIVVIGRTFDSGKDIISLNKEESSWYGSLSYLVLPLSSLLCGSMQHYVGRKHGMWLACVFSIVGYIWAYNATKFIHLVLSSISMGMSIGAAIPPSTAYLSEVIQTRFRGRVLSSMPTCMAVGNLIMYSVDTMPDWKLNAILCTALPAISMVLLIPLPESPSWLVDKGRKMEARKGLCWLRGWVEVDCVDLEFRQICRPHGALILSESGIHLPHIGKEEDPREVIKQGNDNLLQRVMEPATLRPLVFMNCYTFFLVAVSSHGARTYVFNIFETMGNSRRSVGIGVGGIATFGALTCTLIIESAGKRRISLMSMSLCSLISILIGIYMRYAEYLAVPWLFYLLYFLFYYIITIGNIPMPWILMGEIFPQRTKSCCMAITTTMISIYIFASIKAYIYMRDMFGGSYGAFIVNGIIGLLGCWHSFYYFPETEGKSLAEIEEYFSKEPKSIKKRNFSSSSSSSSCSV